MTISVHNQVAFIIAPPLPIVLIFKPVPEISKKFQGRI